MGSDISRVRHDPLKDFGGIVLQQGRLLLDGDFNEYVAMLDRRLRAETMDLTSYGADPTEAGTYFTARPDAVFDIDLGLDGGPDFDEMETLMSITVSGRFLGGVSPAEATTWGAIKALYDD